LIEGSLRDAAFTDVLQIVVAGRKDGVLHLERDDRRARVWITAGRLVAASVDGGVHLGEVLVRLDLLGVDEVQELLAEQAATPGGGPLGPAAIARGWIDAAELAVAVERHIVEVLNELSGWRDGRFRFAEGEPPVGVHHEEGFDALHVLMQVSDARSGEALDPDVVLRRAGDPTAQALSPEAWELLRLVDGHSSARALAAETDLPEGRSLQILAELLDAGVVAPATDADTPPNVLFACADAAEARLLRLALLRHGTRPEMVNDLGAAEAVFDDLRPSAVILDAELDPWGWLRALRRRAEGSHVPVLVIGAGRASWWARRREPGTDRLARPYREVDLQAWLSQKLPRAGH
jgi:hypothetical protein